MSLHTRTHTHTHTHAQTHRWVALYDSDHISTCYVLFCTQQPLEEVFQHHIAEGVKNSSVRQNADLMPASSQHSQVPLCTRFTFLSVPFPHTGESCQYYHNVHRYPCVQGSPLSVPFPHTGKSCQHSHNAYRYPCVQGSPSYLYLFRTQGSHASILTMFTDTLVYKVYLPISAFSSHMEVIPAFLQCPQVPLCTRLSFLSVPFLTQGSHASILTMFTGTLVYKVHLPICTFFSHREVMSSFSQCSQVSLCTRFTFLSVPFSHTVSQWLIRLMMSNLRTGGVTVGDSGLCCCVPCLSSAIISLCLLILHKHSRPEINVKMCVCVCLYVEPVLSSKDYVWS